MRTLQEIASELGTTRQTLYNIVKRKGLSFDDLTTEKQGKTRLFDDLAFEKIKEIFDNSKDNDCQNEGVVNDNLTTNKDCQMVEALTKRVEELEKNLNEALSKNQDLTEEVERLNKLNELQLGTIAALSDTIHLKEVKEQARLVAPARDERKGLFSRFINRIKGNEKA